jgi:hypothetical protein
MKGHKILIEIVPLLFITLLLILVGFTFYEAITGHYQKEQENKFCCDIYPSLLEPEDVLFNKACWGTTYNIEKGYIKCYRHYLVNHERETQSEIIRYKK